MLSASARDFAVHSRFVALEKRDEVTEDQRFRHFQFAFRRPLQGLRSFRKPVQEEIVKSQKVPKWGVRIQPKGLLRSLNPPFVLARAHRPPAR
jgi:hypothetical protein